MKCAWLGLLYAMPKASIPMAGKELARTPTGVKVVDFYSSEEESQPIQGSSPGALLRRKRERQVALLFLLKINIKKGLCSSAIF